MKKVLTIAIAAITVMALVSCGASPHSARQGLTKKVDNAVDAHTSIFVTPPDFVYYSTPVKAQQLQTQNIDLAGFFDEYNASIVAQANEEVQIIVTMNGDNSSCSNALLFVALWDDRDAIYIPSISCTKSNGSMNITFYDYSTVSLTGIASGANTTVMTIKDYSAYDGRYLANNTRFELYTPARTSARK